MSLESKLQDIGAEIQKLQATSSKVIAARERLEAQLSENELVKKVRMRCTYGERLLTGVMQEFEQLTESNTVYKLLGPVLVKQDQEEAKSTVNTRLDFIKSEL